MRAYNGNSRAEEYLQERKFRKRWKKITWLLAAVVAIAVTGAMVLPGLTMEKEPGTLCCALNLHTHVDSCYDADGNLICGYADFVVHTHNAFCYDDNGELICPLEEIQAHTHDASCYQTNLVQICDLEETEGHVHTDQCLSLIHI